MPDVLEPLPRLSLLALGAPAEAFRLAAVGALKCAVGLDPRGADLVGLAAGGAVEDDDGLHDFHVVDLWV
ncbi:MAG: hypothetical protein K0U84_21845 [Actinomycetia bacterium]|nr:hypothetical protein [Actinomycetes bacterium]